MIADELRRQCDNFIELDELREVIGRPPRGEQAAAQAPVTATRTSDAGAAARLSAVPPARGLPRGERRPAARLV